MYPLTCHSGNPTVTCFDGHDPEPRIPRETDGIGQPSAEASIGVVAFRTHRGEPAEAILDARGVWRCPQLPVLDRVLNLLHPPRRDARNGLPFGQAELIRVAAWFKGVARIHRSSP